MHPDPKRILPVLLMLVLLGLAGYYLVWPALNKSNDLIVSGTIEATEVRLSSEFGGRIDAVEVAEGDTIVAGQNLLQVHPSTTARSGASTHERVRSPLNGVVIYRSAEPGEFAAPGAPLLTLGDLEPAHYELISSPTNGVLFAWEAPFVLVKESARTDLRYLRAATKRWMRLQGKK